MVNWHCFSYPNPAVCFYQFRKPKEKTQWRRQISTINSPTYPRIYEVVPNGHLFALCSFWSEYALGKIVLQRRSPLKTIKTNQISVLTLPLLCVCFGVLLAGNCMMYLVGQSYPVFTFSLINATQLALMHSSPFSSIHRSSLTPFIVNSLVLLTVSSTILFQPDYGKSP